MAEKVVTEEETDENELDNDQNEYKKKVNCTLLSLNSLCVTDVRVCNQILLG